MKTLEEQARLHAEAMVEALRVFAKARVFHGRAEQDNVEVLRAGLQTAFEAALREGHEVVPEAELQRLAEIQIEIETLRSEAHSWAAKCAELQKELDTAKEGEALYRKRLEEKAAAAQRWAARAGALTARISGKAREEQDCTAKLIVAAVEVCCPKCHEEQPEPKSGSFLWTAEDLKHWHDAQPERIFSCRECKEPFIVPEIWMWDSV